jgi:hypothetical protein
MNFKRALVVSYLLIVVTFHARADGLVADELNTGKERRQKLSIDSLPLRNSDFGESLSEKHFYQGVEYIIAPKVESVDAEPFSAAGHFGRQRLGSVQSGGGSGAESKPDHKPDSEDRATTKATVKKDETKKDADLAAEMGEGTPVELKKDFFSLKGLPLKEDDVYARYKKYIFAQLDLKERQMLYNERLAQNMNLAGIGLGVVAHVCLFFGLWAAYKEFQAASKVRERAKTARGHREEKPNEPAHPEVANEIEIGLEKIAFKTSLHGAFLFAMTIVLYYLFLKFVLPVSTI